MINLQRRNFIKITLAFCPVFARSINAFEQNVTAETYLGGGLKGFGVGIVGNQNVDYFDALIGTGANLARVFVPVYRCLDCDKYGVTDLVWYALRQVLAIARTRNLKFVLVADFPDVDRPDFWSNNALKASFVNQWQAFSKALGNDPAIAGFDLLNEPNPPWVNGRLENAQALWSDLAEQAVRVIRREKVTLPIIYEAVAGGSSLGLKNLKPLTDSQVVYSIHYYTPHDITHQGVNSTWSKIIPYPAGAEWNLGAWDVEIGITAWNRERLETDLRHTVDFQRRYHRAIYVGEFSCVRWAPDGSRERYLTDCLAIFKKFGWSWSYHEFRGWPGWDAEIDSTDRSVTSRSLYASAMHILQNDIGQRK